MPYRDQTNNFVYDKKNYFVLAGGDLPIDTDINRWMYLTSGEKLKPYLDPTRQNYDHFFSL